MSFITIYTDASFRREKQEAIIAWRGRCDGGTIEGSKKIKSHDVNHAEMSAILWGIVDALERFKNIQGFFINSDNLGCVKAFWTFGDHQCPAPAKQVFDEIFLVIGERWVRTKHVKAHTGRKDVRSYMNRRVDKMTRIERG